MKECLKFGSPGFKLGAFGVVLGLALGGGLLVGATVGPEPSSGDETADHDADQPVASRWPSVGA